jgi:alkylation response protein AidB-like acyl-CoA dehydrogenase
VEFTLTPEQRALRDLAREFAYQEVRPIARRLEREVDPAACYPRELIARSDEVGLRKLKVPKEQGGHGADVLTEVLVLEEICTGDCGFGMTLQHSWREGYALCRLTTEGQRGRYLDAFLTDPTYMTSLCMSEPEVGTDIGAGYAGDLAAGPRTTAREDGDAYVLDGTKRWITNGVNAKIFFIVARTDRTVPWNQGISVFLLPTRVPGLSVTKVEDKLGLRTNMNCEVVLEGARVRKDDLLGEWNRGQAFLHRMGRGAKVKTAAKSLGVARACYEESLALARAAGRVDQRFDDALAVMAMEIESTRSLMWRAAWAVDHDSAAAADLERMAFTKAAEVCARVATIALELHGEEGVERGSHMDKLVRDAVVMLHAGSGKHAIRARLGAAFRAAQDPVVLPALAVAR